MATSLQKLTQTLTDDDVDRLATFPWDIVKHDAAVTGASKEVTGLSSAKKYEITMIATDNTANEVLSLTAAGSCWYSNTNVQYGHSNSVILGNCLNGFGTIVLRITIEPRRNGYSAYSVTACPVTDNVGSGLITWVNGTISTDFTSLTFTLSASSRTVWLTVVERSVTATGTPGSSTFQLADVANDFDPTVSGLAGRVGAVVGTIDQAHAWQKTGTGDTDWIAIDS